MIQFIVDFVVCFALWVLVAIAARADGGGHRARHDTTSCRRSKYTDRFVGETDAAYLRRMARYDDRGKVERS